MPGVELAVGYVFAWLVGKARRVAGRADAQVDQALEAGMGRLGELVSGRLGGDPALERAAEEAEAGQEEPSERTRRRLVDSLADAAERDEDFATALGELVRELQAAGGGAGGGNVYIHAEGGSAAAYRMGDVTIGPPPTPTPNPPQPGPERG